MYVIIRAAEKIVSCIESTMTTSKLFKKCFQGCSQGQYPPTVIKTHPKKSPSCDGGCIFRTVARSSSPAPLPAGEVHVGVWYWHRTRSRRAKAQYCTTAILQSFTLNNSSIICHCIHSDHCAAFPKANFILNRLVSLWLLNMAEREKRERGMPLKMKVGVLLTMSTHLLWLDLRSFVYIG